MKRFAWAIFLVAPALAGHAQQSVSVIVPVVGSSTGPFETKWKTNVVLRNELKTEATVALSLPVAPEQPAILLTIPPGREQQFTDVVGEAFGLDNVLSPLVVQTLGTRSVRVHAAAYALKGGQASMPQPVPVTDANSFAQLRTLGPLSYSDTRRTNIGLINLGEREAVITLALRAQSGEIVGGTRSVLGPNGMSHLAVQLMFPAMKNGDNYSVLVETAARDTYVYASVIDNKTNEADFIVPLLGAR
jgi:hypothetical protein